MPLRGWRGVVATASVVLVSVVALAPTPAASAPRTAPSACAAPTRTVTGGGSAQISVAAGEVVLLTGGTFTGGTNDFAAGSVLCVGVTAAYNPQWFNNPRGSLVVLGSSSIANVSSTETFSLRVEGSFAANAINLNGPAVVVVGATGTLTAGSMSTSTGSVLTNNGTATIGSMNLNGDARIENAGSLTISSGVNANGTILNTGLLTTGGALTMNSGSSIENKCLVNVGGDMTINSISARSSGIMRLSGVLRVNGTFVQTIEATLLAAGLSNDGSIAGFGRYRFSGDTRTQRAFAGSSAADPIVVQDLSPPPPPRIFDTQSGIVVNVVAGSVTDPPAGARSVGCTATATPNADLTVFVTGPAQATAGEAVTYTLTVSNAGPAAAAAATTTLALSPAVTIVDADGGVVAGPTLTWTHGSIAAGATIALEVVVSAPPSGTLVARVSATSTTVDPVPGNNDGSSADHVVETSIVAVVPPNRPPEVSDSEIAAYVASPITGSVVIADPDVGQSVVATLTSGPLHGNASVNPSGAFSYTPTGDFTGLDSFTVTACDNGEPSLCGTGTVRILIFPRATSDSARTTVDTSVMIPVRDNDVGQLASGLTLRTLPSSGTATVVGNEVRYTPAAAFVGADAFTYEICSPDGAACSGGDVVVVVEQPPVNNAPVVNSDAFVTTTGVEISGTVTASDLDTGQSLTFGLATGPTSGSASVDPNGEFTYAPATGFSGIDSFEVTACDDGTPSLCDTAEIVVTVLPLARDDAASTTLGVAVAIDVLANDLGTAPPPAISGVVADGTAVVQPDATVLFTPAPGFTGTTTFTYEACSPSAPTLCSSGVVTVTVGPQPNRPPVLAPAQIDTEAETPAAVRLEPADPDAGQVLAMRVSNPASDGVAVLTGDVVTYTPGPGFAGVDSFDVEVCDDAATPLCATGIVSVNVRPVAGNIAVATEVGQPVSIELDPLVVGSVGPPSTVVDPSHGTITLGTGLELIYAPDSDFAGRDVFTYQVCATSAPTLCAEGAVSVAVYPVASDFLANTVAGVSVDAPVLDNDQAASDTEATIVEGPVNGTAVVLTGRVIRYTPSGAFTGVETITYQDCTTDASPLCSSAVLTVEVAPSVLPDTATTPQGTAVTIDVGANDFGEAGAPMVVLGPDSGSTDASALLRLGAPFVRDSVVIRDYVPIVYRPLPGFVGVDTFVYLRCAVSAPHVCRSTVVTVTVTAQIPPDPTTTTTTTSTTTVPGTTTTLPATTTTVIDGSGGLPPTGGGAGRLALSTLGLVAVGMIVSTVRRRPRARYG